MMNGDLMRYDYVSFLVGRNNPPGSVLTLMRSIGMQGFAVPMQRVRAGLSQLQLNKQSEEMLDQYRCQIQELKLKHRKLRMKFENQLHQLIEQHKNLLAIFAPERLPSEIESAENSKSQLVATELLKMAQLRILEEEVL
ncbi:Synaptonemal complex central element protein 1 [Merluccius polli]|uniref:Synaptonemal complex central element protein 1 n=1 Tax=Merluccius polli TaxID=89951 RepID=A0AA47ME37_MERPO|nr:Synaptonemal complex central element protein 1 [Merluccius polli]